MIYWILLLFYVALIVQEIVNKNYWKVLYWAGTILLTVSLMNMK